MPAIMKFGNLTIFSVDSDVLVIYAHSGYRVGDSPIRVPRQVERLVWHAGEDYYSCLPQGLYFIQGTRVAGLKDFGGVDGGNMCVNYILSADRDIPETLPPNPEPYAGHLKMTLDKLYKNAKVDFCTPQPGLQASLEDVFDAILNRRLHYREIHHFGCRSVMK